MVTHKPPAHTFNYDGAIINIYHANKGEGLPQHSHAYSHATFCTAGSCIVRTEKGGDFVVDKNHQPLDLSAGNWHEIEALEDNTVFINVFAEGKY
jgi:quercetin dioxygenase-like cupin family protein